MTSTEQWLLTALFTVTLGILGWLLVTVIGIATRITRVETLSDVLGGRIGDFRTDLGELRKDVRERGHTKGETAP